MTRMDHARSFADREEYIIEDTVESINETLDRPARS